MHFGRYRLDVASADPNGPDTSVDFDAGWYVDANADTPDMLQVALDKPEYHAGDTMTVAVTARNAGQVTLNVIGDHLLATQTTAVKEGTSQLKVPVGHDWGTGAYIVATLRRPLDAPAQRMPGRAIGVQWFSIDKTAKTLTVDLSAPALLRPNTALHVPVKVSGLASGEEARIVVAAVDVGILNLTNYKPPSPTDYYLGQRALSADLRDLYGQLIDGMQGTRGEIRSGGDEGAALHGSPPTGPPVALYSGLVTVGKDGTADVAFDIPDFAGTVRVMAVAWSKDKVGQGTADVTVRDPVVLSATLPRFLLPGDRSNVHLDLDNVEGQPGDYTIALTSADAVIAGAGATQKLTLRAKERGSVEVPITADKAGSGAIKVAVSGPAGYAARTQLHTAGAAAGANPGAAHGERDRQGRKRYAVERHVRRSRAGHRQRFGLGRRVDRARCGGASRGARPLSVSLLGADHEPRAAAPLYERSRDAGACRARSQYRSAHPRHHRRVADAAGQQRLVRPVEPGRR